MTRIYLRVAPFIELVKCVCVSPVYSGCESTYLISWGHPGAFFASLSSFGAHLDFYREKGSFDHHPLFPSSTFSTRYWYTHEEIASHHSFFR